MCDFNTHTTNKKACTDWSRPKWQLRHQSHFRFHKLHGAHHLIELIGCDVQQLLDLWIRPATCITACTLRVGAIPGHGLRANHIEVYIEAHELQDRCLDEAPTPRPVAAFVAKVNQGLASVEHCVWSFVFTFDDHQVACDDVVQLDVLPHAPATKIAGGQGSRQVLRVRPQVPFGSVFVMCSENAAIRHKHHIAIIRIHIVARGIHEAIELFAWICVLS